MLFVGDLFLEIFMSNAKKMTNTRKMVVTAMLASIASVLMLIEIPLPFIAPSFYKLDFSEIPAMIGGFALGPVAGILIEAVKILVNFLINGTVTGGIGELSNFVIGCSFIVPASLIYKHKKTKKNAIFAMIIGTLSMAVLGIFINAYIMIPLYSELMIPLDQIIQMGTDIIPFITDTLTFCIFCVAPFNLIKGAVITLVTAFIYKPLSRVIHKKS